MRISYYICSVFQLERAAKDTKKPCDRQILTVKAKNK